MIHAGISGRDLAKVLVWQADDPFIPGARIDELTIAEARLLAGRILHVVDVIEGSAAYRIAQGQEPKEAWKEIL